MEISSSTNTSSTSVTDLDVDSLAHCASYLSLQDLSNMAMTCKFFRRAAYSDSIWQRWFREHWPQQISSSFLQTSGVREAYLARRSALQQFKFVDPFICQLYSSSRPYNYILLDKNDVYLSQGSVIQIMKIDTLDIPVTLADHNARITCMRLFSLSETSLFRNDTHKKDNALVTSSCDHSIRLWWKGHCQRCFRGHNGPVTTLSEKLLGGYSGKLLASGGEDGTVRLWSLASSGKRGQHALRTTFHGHEKPISLLSVAGHKASLLLSISKDAKVRVWDTTVSSAAHSSCCVGMTSVAGAPVGIKCYESLCYIAAGAFVTAIDLRTMRKVFTAAVHRPKLYSFEMLPSKYMICTGGNYKALLWDVRKNQEEPEPVAELDGHVGPVQFIHMDPYKIVTSGPEDFYVKVWDSETGKQTNSLACCMTEESVPGIGCSATAVNGFQMVTASCGRAAGLLCFRDYTNAARPVPSQEDNQPYKFWEPQLHSDGSDG
ncbi:PREDICTED: probable E3 ubiquitin ligase complex SCF subunit sconB [Nelumbo nucifera]|uniref:F-box domain-containing protein n=2 Tax=Nelumbo nucifera TaxID=4432 RepID=A0A822YQD5_NELNU|nr:PREDICTED: probable E3 ubiquitin ligase complex SCF subunit sconB [Nelumbo nucifera]DAD34802.1 TPA_asm: hypothetical protein HUJ06_005442 [Nelumbo nucifera]